MTTPESGPGSGTADEGRRRLVVGATALGALALAGLADLLVPGRRHARGYRLGSAAGPTPTGPTPSASSAATPTTGAAATSAPAGQQISSLADLRSQGAVSFSANGAPGIAVALPGGKVAAFSRVCTHQGCLVDYDTASGLFVCPCHGAEYDPGQAAAVVAGPAPAPLDPIPVIVDGTAVRLSTAT
jgi:Rieske Fe-S protein